MKTLSEIVNGLNESTKQARENSKTLVSEVFAAYFREVPEVDRVRWTQYTPYFNDGSPCTFSAGEVSVTGKNEEFAALVHGRYEASTDADRRWFNNDEESRCLTLDENPVSPHGTWFDPRRLEAEDGPGAALARAFDDDTFERALKIALGEGVVTAKRDGTFEVKDCDHD